MQKSDRSPIVKPGNRLAIGIPWSAVGSGEGNNRLAIGENRNEQWETIVTAFRSINPSVVRFRVRNHPFEKRANRGTKERDESLILALSLHPCLLRVFSSPRKSLLRRVPRFRSSVSLSYDCYYSENRYLFPRSRNIIYKKESMNFSRWIYIARKKGC